ncbi:MAG: NADH-quinone oxidoreductase subunit A [Desulfuromonadales bacterium]
MSFLLFTAALSPPPVGGEAAPNAASLLSLGLYVGIAVVLILLLLFLAWWLGQKTSSPVKSEPYESGVLPSGQARLSEPVPFYLVAIFFIVFDVEMIFVVAWAVAWDLLGWAGFLNVAFFIFILFVGLAHLWKTGGLDWGPARIHRRREKGNAG